jgi:ABC-type amino acid transport substrate-binding protein
VLLTRWRSVPQKSVTFHARNEGISPIDAPAASPRLPLASAVLLAMREDGSYDQIYDKWFTSK